MAAPALQVFAQGQSSVSADNLNTFVQSCTNFAQLRAFVGAPGVTVLVRGASTADDGGQGIFWWNPAGVAADDNNDTIVPPGAAAGEWQRLTLAGSGGGGGLTPIANNTVLGNVSGATATPVAVDSSALATLLGLGTAAFADLGTSGTKVPLLSTANTWGATQTFGTAIATVVQTTAINTAAGQQVSIVNTASPAVTVQLAGAASGGNARVGSSAGQLVLGTGAALATNATAGFVTLPSMPGVPSGVPTSASANTTPVVIDTTDSKLYAYIGGVWADLTGGGGGGAVTSWNTRTGAVTLATSDVNAVLSSTNAVTISPTGGSGTVTINPAVASTMDNVAIGLTKPTTGTFTGIVTGSAYVVGVVITNGGSGYATAPTVSFSGGGGSGAVGVASLGSGGTAGKVTGIYISDPGSGYTSAPTVTFSGGGGAGAAGSAVMGTTCGLPTTSIGNEPVPTPGTPLLTAVNLQGVTTKANEPEFLVNIGLISNKGSGASPHNNGDKVALYIGTSAFSGSGDVWNMNTVLAAYAGSGTISATAWEPDLVNANSSCTMVGINMAGNTAGGAKIAAAFQVLAVNNGDFNNGIVIGGAAGGGGAIAASGGAFVDTGTSGSTSLLVSGSHTRVIYLNGVTGCTNGIDFGTSSCTNGVNFTSASLTTGVNFNVATMTRGIWFNGCSATYGIDCQGGSLGAAIRLGNNQNLVARNAANSADVIMLHYDGSNQVLMGDNTYTAGLYVGTRFNGFFGPNQDQWTNCGQNGLAWGTVYAYAYSTISDPDLKKGIDPLPSVAEIVKGLDLISYELKDDSNSKRRWGFNAKNVKQVFEKEGHDCDAWDEDKETGRKTVSLVALLALALKHNQELEARLAKLEMAA